MTTARCAWGSASTAARRAVGVARRSGRGGVRGVGDELGGALGIAILGSIANAVCRAEAPAGAPETIGAAGPDTLGAARDAFTQGMQVASGIAAAVLVAAAVVAVTMLRRPAVAVAAA